MQQVEGVGAFHNAGDIELINTLGTSQDSNGTITHLPFRGKFSYEFENFFHPFVGRLIRQLNQTSVAGMLDPSFLENLHKAYTSADYTVLNSLTSAVTLEDRTIDVSIGGPYANYNWELLYHIPVMIAVHLSSNQRFAEAQQWFHLVFDPTSTDTSVPPRAVLEIVCVPRRRRHLGHQHPDHPAEHARLAAGRGPDPGQDGRHHRLQRHPCRPVRPARWSPAPGPAPTSGTW